MRSLRVATVFIFIFFLSACASLPGFGKKTDQTSPDSVAQTYIEAFYTGNSNTIKNILLPSELTEINEDPEASLIFVAVENIGKYIKNGGGYKNLKMREMTKDKHDTARTYYYRIELPYVTRHSPTEWLEESSSIDLVKDANGLWWIKQIDGIYKF
ncbi:TPA: hypothetical protein ACS7XF_002503 [Providencia alcalifaciens]